MTPRDRSKTNARPGTRKGRRNKKRHGGAKTPPIVSQTLNVVIDSLGAQGDGVAKALGTTLYIPGALPGEQVRVQTSHRQGDGIHANLIDVQEPSPHRVAPPCPYFGRCGGCQLQHLSRPAYGAWKQDRVSKILAQRGIQDVPVLAPVLIPQGTRRRVTFSAEKKQNKLHFGFNAKASHHIETITSCPLLIAPLNDLIAPLTDVMNHIIPDGARARILVTGCENGADILIESTLSLTLADREHLATFANGTGVARVAWRDDKDQFKQTTPEPIAMTKVPAVNISGVLVDVPMGGFLQASEAGEQAILKQILAGVHGATQIADLYCGLGSFSLPLCRTAIVRAIDKIETPVRALERAAGRADRGGRIIGEVRDLDRQPLEPKDLSKFEALVFDPPRAGAREQVVQIALSDVPLVVAVSCNPATFARDARVLIDGGYRLIDVLPIDQFTYSPHVEVVARFER